MQERLMYGGARLAALIEDIYADNRSSIYAKFNAKVLSFLN